MRRARSASRSKPSPKAVPGRGRSAEAVDESETGSANFYGPFWSGPQDWLQPVPAVHLSLERAPGQIAKLTVAPLKKEKCANCAHVSFGELDPLAADVSVLLAPSTERE